jgi:hypothetical protein
VFETLPLELLTEIAKWTNHPGDILSLAYTSKNFYNLLSREKSKSVWEHARARMKLLAGINVDGPGCSSWTDFNPICRWENLAIPAPLIGQSEMSLAQLIFEMECHSCKNVMVEFTWNVVLGTRICPVS